MKKRKIFTLCCFLGLLISGCNGAFDSGQIVPTYTITTPPLVLTPTITHTPVNLTSTITLEPSMTVTVTETPAPVMPIQMKCVDMVASLPPEGLTGKLIIEYQKYELSDKALLKNLETDSEQLFPPDPYFAPGHFIVSPDRNWFAFLTGSKVGNDAIIVQSANGSQRFVYPVDYQKWNWANYWLDNEWLVLQKYDQPYDSFILLNPFTGQQKPVEYRDFPELYPEDWAWERIVSFDPSFILAAYLGADVVGKYESYVMKLVLWDMVNEQKVAELPLFGYSLRFVRWSPDGERFAYVNGLKIKSPSPDSLFQADLVLADRKGNILYQTDFPSVYTQSDIPGFEWSTDGRYLAFVLEASDLPGRDGFVNHLMVLDTADFSVADYCLSPAQFSSLVWSPDSRFLAIYSEDKEEKTVQAMLVDLVTLQASVIGENVIPYGWLK